GDPNILYVGAASGGVWKTIDGGLSFEPIFDDQPIASIGDLALAPSNPDVIYVGTGEANVRNSVSYGNGIYKSTDGGASWKHMGLDDTRHISRIVVHPTDPDIVYVGALGHIFGPNEERGVFRSTDGGASWEKVLFVDDRHGVSDLDMDPTNPNILYAGFWHFERKPWTHRTGSEEGGVWKTVDGGASWEKLDEGLPGLMGRIGVKVAPSNPQVVYLIVESDEGTFFRSQDRGETFERMTDNVQIVSRGLYYTDMRVDPQNENRVYAISSRLFASIDGGNSWERISKSTHVDFHSLWIDPLDPRRIWQGQDGGIAVSYDRGGTWDPIRNLPIAQFYQVFHDDREPFYYLGGGLQDNGTWYGPSRTREPAGILEDDWRMMSFGDAYWVVPHPDDPELFLSEYQGGGIVRTDMRTRQQIDVSPQPRRNDGGPVGVLEYRFNWNAPIVASPHDPHTIYFAGNVVFKTRDFGDSWQVISPDLTTNDPEKQGEAGGPAWTENTTAEYHTTLISFAESPVQAGLLWAGSDDGRLHVSHDGGDAWQDVTTNVPDMPEFSPVSHIEPSRTSPTAAYIAFDRHMFDDFRPHIYVTNDSGGTFQRISDGLPEGAWVWIVRQDPRNHDLLWAGTELGLYASHDRGGTWRRLHLKNLPTVAVHDVLVHPRENDLILGTHGRAIWVFDDATPLQEFDPTDDEQKTHLFGMRPALRYPSRFTRYGLGDRRHKAPNPPAGALVTYYLSEDLEEEDEAVTSDDSSKAAKHKDESEEAEEERLKIEILDVSGETIRTLDGESLGRKKGLNRVAWDLAMDGPRQRTDEKPEADEFDGPPRGPWVLPGTYTVRLTFDEEMMEAPVEVRVDPSIDVGLEDLRQQFLFVKALQDKVSVLNDGLRRIDAVTAQLAARRATVKKMERDLPDDLLSALSDYEQGTSELVAGLARAEDKPYWSQGPRLSERLQSLAREADGQFAAPTRAQIDYLAELEAEFQEKVEEVNILFTDTLPTLNGQLQEQGIPSILLPAALEVPVL
ncbi:MAG: glycosyl hydrolase, partial [Thermoanaerobaculia bacterium]